MTRKTGASATISATTQELDNAVAYYVARGGVIKVVPEGETKATSGEGEQDRPLEAEERESLKLEQLKGLVAKGAGVSAIQYSLRMNRKDIRRLASEHGLKIRYSRALRGSRSARARDSLPLDDSVAGHAMHYSTLGYTIPEIAQLLEVSVRDVLNICKDYRIDINNSPRSDAVKVLESDTLDSSL